MNSIDDTIVAVSTPPGRGAIGIVRMSGKEAVSIADRVYVGTRGESASDYRSHTIHRGILTSGQETIDEALICIMKAPASYTGEDVVEMNCHGNPLILAKVVDACVAQGARVAEPGEFTKRAFLNGRIDLSQAEAVARMIDARNEAALKAAIRGLRGESGMAVRELREELISSIAEIEARLDFPEEELEGQVKEDVIDRLKRLSERCCALRRAFAREEVLSEEIRVAIIGAANVGKSTIFNYLAGREKAIVTSEAGTTRDIIEDRIEMEGRRLIIMDTAGFGIEGGEAEAGAIGIVRMSGKEAVSIADRVYVGTRGESASDYRSHTIHRGILTSGQETIDEALICIMKAPASYTGEDVVEMNCHGNPLILAKVVDACVAQGARVAEPGEFTKRAFLNGRIDLSQAEAVARMIDARNEAALKAAIRGLRGESGMAVRELREELISSIAEIEARLDFPEEELEGQVKEDVIDRLKRLSERCCALRRAFAREEVLSEEIRVAIIGAANVGKSTIFNYLAGREKAIVTSEAGTTRDIIEDRIEMEGRRLIIMDTAGFGIEGGEAAAGAIRMSRKAMESAQALIFVIDRSRVWGAEEQKISAMLDGGNAVLVFNKMDLPARIDTKQIPDVLSRLASIEVSAKTGDGMGGLRTFIKERLIAKVELDEAGDGMTAGLRHIEEMKASEEAMRRAVKAMEDGVSHDAAVIDLRDAMRCLGRITGETVEADILERIFSRFCIGK